MTLSQSDASDSRVSFLTDQWRTTSLATVWTHPGDWHAVAANSLVRAVVQSDEANFAAAALGAERAAQGVGLSESLRDLAVLFDLVGEQLPLETTDSFSASWVEVSTEALLNKKTVDALTGVMTLDYLLPRLRELYLEAAVRHLRPDDERCLIVVDRCESAPSGWRRVMHEGRVGRVLRATLDHGQTNSVLPSGVFVSLAHRDDALDENVVRIRRALSSETGDDIAVHVEALPSTILEAEDLLLSL